MADLDDLLIPIDVDSWRTFELNAAEELGFITTTWRNETPERALIEIDSRGLNLLGGVAYEAIRGGFLRYARGAWLTLLASDTFETERRTATYASCYVMLTGSSGIPNSIPAGDRVILKKAGTDITYSVAGPFTIPGNGSTAASLIAVCETVGTAGNAAIGTITELQDALPGVSVVNATAAVAIDDEPDAALQTRARASTGPLSPAGPTNAYEYIAKSAKRLDGTSVDVIKTLIRTDEDTGDVTAYYASASGPSVDVGSNIAPDPGTVNYEILRLVKPNGVKCLGYSAILLPVTLVITAAIRLTHLKTLGLTLDQAEEKTAAYLTTFFKNLPIEGLPLVVAIPGKVGWLPKSDVSDVVGESIRLGGDVSNGDPGEKVIYSINVGGSDILFAAGEVAGITSITITWIPVP
jgi:hypothetical protein